MWYTFNMTEQNAEISTYAEQFRILRDKTGLDPKSFGEQTGLTEEKVVGIEAEEVSPPRKVTFYESLSTLPNVIQQDVDSLLASQGAPRWLAVEGDPSNVNPEFVRIAEEVNETVRKMVNK